MPQALDRLSRELRSAVLAADHAGAERLVLDYSKALREFWTTLPEHDRAASQIPAIAQELLDWVRQMTLVQRAMTVRQLSIAQKACRYQVARPPALGTGVQLRG